jgi:hypothetical protein
MSKSSPTSRKRRRRPVGVIRDSHGNRISTEALDAAASAPAVKPAKADPRPARTTRPRPLPRDEEGGLRPAFVIVAFLIIIIGGAYLLVPPPPVAAPKPRDEAATTKTLYLGVLKIEAYRKLNGMLPYEMEVANIRRKDGYSYERLDDRHYLLTFRESDGRTMSFDSHTPIERFFGPPEAVLGGGEGS